MFMTTSNEKKKELLDDLTITIEQYRLGQIMEKSGMYEDFEQGLKIEGISIV